MADEILRFKDLIGRLIDTKQDKQNYIGGLLGTYVNGNKTVRVPNQAGYVYVRLNGSYNEVITAVNGVVAEVFDLKVLVTVHPANPGVYVIWGRDLNQYSSFANNNGQGASSYLPHHGDTHSFGNGVDPTFIYKRQLMQPLGAHPTNPISSKLYVEPDFYVWQNQVKYFYGLNTTDLTAAVPNNGQFGRYLTIYLDGNSNSLAYLTGADFVIWPFQATGTVNTIITPLASVGIPLAAVLLTSGSATFDWNSVKDIRNFLDGGGTQALLHPLDPSGGYHTGILNAVNVIINDPGHYYTGTTNVDQAFQEIGAKLGTGTIAAPHQIISATHTDSNTGTIPIEGRILAYHTGNWYAEDAIDISSDSANILTINFQIQTGTILTPGSGHRLLFARSDGIYTKDSSGIEVGPFGTGTSSGGGGSAGTGTANQIGIIDVNDYYTGSNVESALQEIGNSLGNLRGGHDHGVTRLSIISGTSNIPLFDFVQTIEYASFAGTIIDPITYSISTGSDYIVLDNPTTGSGIFITAYQILNI